jgi:NAD(P)-dependent dehydrogenase (short-subunit alcohol dehydrogenase family)
MIAGMSGRAVVTGAARGIGAAIAARLEGDGYEVMRLDRHAGPGVIECDVADANAVNAVAERVGPVDALVNNAGIWLFDALENVSPEAFAAPFAVNVRGAFHCAQAFGRSMLARGNGAIVNVVSIAAYRANPGEGGYGPSSGAPVADRTDGDRVGSSWRAHQRGRPRSGADTRHRQRLRRPRGAGGARRRRAVAAPR